MESSNRPGKRRKGALSVASQGGPSSQHLSYRCPTFRPTFWALVLLSSNFRPTSSVFVRFRPTVLPVRPSDNLAPELSCQSLSSTCRLLVWRFCATGLQYARRSPSISRTMARTVLSKTNEKGKAKKWIPQKSPLPPKNSRAAIQLPQITYERLEQNRRDLKSWAKTPNENPVAKTSRRPRKRSRRRPPKNCRAVHKSGK